MDKYIKQTIDARRNAFAASYEFGAAEQQKIDALFVEIDKLGEKCKDVSEFEAEFAKSPLNQKYLDLFTEIATNGQAKVQAPKVSKAAVGKMVAEGTAVGIAESVADQAINTIAPTRAAVNQEVYDTARKVPVLGDAIDIGQKAGYASHLADLFRKKKKD